MTLPETFKPLTSEIGPYEVSDHGTVRRLGKTKPLCRVVNRIGYVKTVLSCTPRGVKCCSVHRLVAIAHIPNPKGYPEINHLDGNKENNHISNLEWITKSENHRHKFRLHPHLRSRAAIRRSRPVRVSSRARSLRFISAIDAARRLGITQMQAVYALRRGHSVDGSDTWDYLPESEAAVIREQALRLIQAPTTCK